MLTITPQKQEQTLTFLLNGQLDTTTAPQLETALNTNLSDDVTTLVFDLQNVGYVSSAGLRIFLSAHKKMTGKGSFSLLHVNDDVKDVLDMTGFTDILTIA